LDRAPRRDTAVHAGVAGDRGPGVRAGAHLGAGGLHHGVLHPAVVRPLRRHAALRADAAAGATPRCRPAAALVPDRAPPAGHAGRGLHRHHRPRAGAARNLHRAPGSDPVAPEATARVSGRLRPRPLYSLRASGEERPTMPDRPGVSAVLSRNLVAYLLSRFCSGCAMTMLRAGIAWHVFALPTSAFPLGRIGAVQLVPALGLLLVAGTLADVWDRRRIMMGAQMLALSCAGVLLGATAGGRVTVMLLYGLILLIAVAAAFENPSRAALLPTLVPREIFPRAVTVATTNQALAFASGPALG